MLMEGQVGAPTNVSATDGTDYKIMLGKQREIMVSELHGKYSAQNYRGNVAMASLTTGTALVAPATNATPNFCIWNPAGNNMAASLIKFFMAYLSGTPAAAGFGYSYVPYAGSTIGSTAAVSAFTSITVRSGVLGRAYAGNVLAGSAASITGTGIAAAAVARYSGLSSGAIASASVADGMNMVEEFDGNMIIPPGVLWYPHSAIASVALYHLAAVWDEIPWP